MPGPVITLTTDFGMRDAYVAAMRGVILGINPQAVIVDVTHSVPPQDVLAGAFTFEAARPYFPPGAIHVVVIDPSVGTARRPLLLVGPNACFVCPDNGVLAYCYANSGFAVPDGDPGDSSPVPLPLDWRAYHLANPHYWRQPLSNTFHGRDLFAPVAGYLSRGVPPESMGPEVKSVTSLCLPTPREQDGKLVGQVIHQDHFGNLVTNIPAGALAGLAGGPVVEVGGRQVQGLASSYQEKNVGDGLTALVGSHGYLEIAVANGSAAQLLRLAPGAPVRLRPAKPR